MKIHVFDVDRPSKHVLGHFWLNLGANKPKKTSRWHFQTTQNQSKIDFEKCLKTIIEKQRGKRTSKQYLGAGFGEGSATELGPREGFREFGIEDHRLHVNKLTKVILTRPTRGGERPD